MSFTPFQEYWQFQLAHERSRIANWKTRKVIGNNHKGRICLFEPASEHPEQSLLTHKVSVLNYQILNGY